MSAPRPPQRPVRPHQRQQPPSQQQKRTWVKSTERPRVQSMMQRLEALEEESQVHIANTGHSRWMIPYADLITLLLGLFMLLFSMSTLDNRELNQYATELRDKLTEQTLLADASAQKAGGDVNFTGFAADISPEKTLTDEITEQLAEYTQADPTLADIQISIEARGVVISLPDTLLFPAGSADLSAGARTMMDKLAATLKPLARPIRVEGHTDDSPIATSRFPSNWELSTARATNILKYLVSSQHMAPDQMSAAGYGEFRPVADNSSIEGKQRNRRVDIVVLSAESALAEPADQAGRDQGDQTKQPVLMPSDDDGSSIPAKKDGPDSSVISKEQSGSNPQARG